MTCHHFSQLRHLLQHAPNFTSVMSYFFDHLGDTPQLQTLSLPTRHPVLEKALRATVAHMSKGDMRGLKLLSVTTHGFFHGGFVVGDRLGILLYFEDLQLGLACLVNSRGQTQLARFRACYLPMPCQN